MERTEYLTWNPDAGSRTVSVSLEGPGHPVMVEEPAIPLQTPPTRSMERNLGLSDRFTILPPR